MHTLFLQPGFEFSLSGVRSVAALLFARLVPIGFEDEEGFHYGHPQEEPVRHTDEDPSIDE